MSRIDIKQDVVLERVVARLRDQLKMSDRQCYETLDALSPPIIPKGGQGCVAVSAGASTFVTGEQAPVNFTEEWSVTVTVYTRMALDAADHAEKWLRAARRGMLVLKRDVLAALVGYDLEDKDGHTFLRTPLYATRAHAPVVVERSGERDRTLLGLQSIDFGVDFDWDLT